MNGEDLGIYVNVQPVKRGLLRGHFDDANGDLYEGTVSDFRDGWYQTFEPKNEFTDIELGPILGVEEHLLEFQPDIRRFGAGHVPEQVWLEDHP